MGVLITFTYIYPYLQSNASNKHFILKRNIFNKTVNLVLKIKYCYGNLYSDTEAGETTMYFCDIILYGFLPTIGIKLFINLMRWM